MNLEELKALISSSEGETLGVKETTGQRVDACETLCAFLNKDGGALGGARSRATKNETQADARERVPPERNPSLFQRECWDTQLRKGDSYAAKWEYARNNPVRSGLVDNVDAWPYQGEMNILEWHDR